MLIYLICATAALLVFSTFMSLALFGAAWVRHENGYCGKGCLACEIERTKGRDV